MSDKPVSVRIPPQLRTLIDELREQERRSLNAQIIVLLEEALAERALGEGESPAMRAGGTETPRPEAAPSPSARTTTRTRHRSCPHRVPKGAFCKRCQRVIE